MELKSSRDSVAPEKMTGIERLKRNEPPFFKKTSIAGSKEDQFNACKSILEVVEDPAVVLKRTDFVKAKGSLDKGMS